MNMMDALNAYNARICEINEALPMLDDDTALSVPTLFPAWAAGVDYAADVRVRYGEKLYKCVQAHTSQTGWEPPNVPALWMEVAKPGEGDDKDHPIPYDNNMELFEGKYYAQDGSVYYCFRSTGVPVYNPLSALVGIYVNLV